MILKDGNKKSYWNNCNKRQDISMWWIRDMCKKKLENILFASIDINVTYSEIFHLAKVIGVPNWMYIYETYDFIKSSKGII